MNRVLSICHLLLLSILLQHKEVPVGSNPSEFTSAVQINPERECGLFPKMTADGCRQIETGSQAQPVSLRDVIHARVPAPQKCSGFNKLPRLAGSDQSTATISAVPFCSGQEGLVGG